MRLRGYQEKEVSDIAQAFSGGAKSALFVLPTGGGKTTVFSEVVKREAGRVMVLAHRRELIEQAAARLRVFGMEPGLILAGEPEAPHERVQVGSIQTLARRPGRYGSPDLIIIDEAHRGVAASYEEALKAYPGARVLGLTATPCRLDGKGLSGAFERLIEGPSVEDLIAGGYLMRPRVYSASIPDLTGVRTRGGDYDAKDLAEALARSSVVGDAVQSYAQHAEGRSCIAFCAGVEHAEQTAAAFNAAGVAAEVLTGATPKDERAAALARLRSGETRVLATIEVLTEGFDFEALGALILLRPTKSLALYLQMCGRVLRVAEGKADAVILDHAGNTLRHGLIEEAREWTLEGAAARDPQKTTTAGETLSVRHCPKCFGVHAAAPVCPLCGHEHARDARIPAARAGQLALLKREELEAARQAQKRAEQSKRKNEERAARSLEDFVRLGKARGYRFPAAWARHRFEARRGRGRAVGNDGW